MPKKRDLKSAKTRQGRKQSFACSMSSTRQRNISEITESFREVSESLADRTRELEALALRYEIAVESSPNAMIMVDEFSRMILVNRETEVLFGYDRSDLIGQSVDMLVPDSIRPGHPEMFASFFENPVSRALGVGRDLHGRRKDGSEVRVEIGLNPIQTDEGMFVTASIVDISERVQLEERFRVAIEAAPNAMIMVDQAGEMVLVNRQTELLFGYERDDLIGQSVDMLVPDSVRPKHPALFASFFENPTARSMGVGRDLMGRRKDGSEVPVEIGLNPIETDGGIFVVASVVDISERAEAEEIREKQVTLIAKNVELERFAYIASHDLKSPLGGIAALASCIESDLEGKISEGTKEDLSLMKSRIQRMETMIDDLLTYARAGQEDQAPVLVDTKELVEGLVDMLDHEGIDLELVLGEQLPIFETQKTALELVLRNLIHNAIKHCKRSDLCIEVNAKELQDQFEFSVRDNGPGIAEEFREVVFEMFKQLESRDTVGGSGMGLAVVRKTIESRGGKLELYSDATRGGCEFRFTWDR